MSNKKPEITLPLSSEGLLGIYWAAGPYGLAFELSKDLGIGFFSADNQLLAVEFFDVDVKADKQELIFKNGISVLLCIKDKKIKDLTVREKAQKSAAIR